MLEFNHPHVLSLIGVCLDTGPGVSIVMPFMANGSLKDYLKRERDKVSYEQKSKQYSVIGFWYYLLGSKVTLLV